MATNSVVTMSTATPDIIKSFLPIFYISKLFGCSLYSLPRPLNATNINAPLTAIDVLLCVIQFALYLFMIIPLAKDWHSYDSDFNNEFAIQIGSSGLVVIIFIGQSLDYIVSVTNLFVIIMDMRNSADIRRVLLSLIEFAKQMLGSGTKVESSNKAISLSYGLLALLWQIPTIWLKLQIAKGTKDASITFIIATHIGHAMLVGCTSSYLTTFWYILVNVAHRFRVVNNCLRKHLNERRVGPSTDYRHKNFSEDYAFVRSISTHHLKLVHVVDKISKANALQFEFSTVPIFLSALVTLFMIYQATQSIIVEETPAAGAFYTVATIYNSFLLYKTISVGSEMGQQRNITRSLINKAIASERNKLLSLQFHHFSQQVEHSNVSVSCGLFTIDWTLMYTLTAALTTYLLLFIQFDSTSAKN